MTEEQQPIDKKEYNLSIQSKIWDNYVALCLSNDYTQDELITLKDNVNHFMECVPHFTIEEQQKIYDNKWSSYIESFKNRINNGSASIADIGRIYNNTIDQSNINNNSI